MASYSIGEIATILNPVTSYTEISDPSLIISHLLTDSRSLTYPESTLFFAITTGSGDGHRYIDQLYRNGVRAFVVASLPDGSYPGASFIVVDDPLKALQMLGTANRSRYDSTPVIAITGSRGKTTVKELLFQLLGRNHTIARSPRSFNSRIGVPLSLWETDPACDMSIIEAGISRRGEMEPLAKMIRPTIGILTCIDDDHSAGFASRREDRRKDAALPIGRGHNHTCRRCRCGRLGRCLRNLRQDYFMEPQPGRRSFPNHYR